MSVTQILVESSNIGTITVVQETMGSLQAPRLHARRSASGEKTALDFPGESTGILKEADDL